MTKLNKFLLFNVALLSCPLSAWLTIQMCIGLSDTAGHEAIALGVVLELSKYVFFAVGHASRGKRRCLCICTAIVLTSVSLWASISYYQQKDETRTEVTINQSAKYTTLLRTQDILTQRINALRQSARRYEEFDRITKAANVRAEVPSLISQLTTNATTLDHLRDSHQDSPYTSLLKTVLYSVLALLLEVCSVLALRLLQSRTQDSVPDYPNEYKHLDDSQYASLPPVPVVKDPYDRVVDAIQAKDIAPTYAAIRRVSGVGQSRVADIVTRLVNDGIIKREGRGYVRHT